MALGISAGCRHCLRTELDPVTTRAAGMAGAFVAVTDDASSGLLESGGVGLGCVLPVC